ncbi:MAG: ergothioneine biosynthesis protein EgtB [Stackebrandtia sp.]
MNPRTLETADESAVKSLLAEELERARARSAALTVQALDDSELTVQHSPLMSPLAWDLAHVGNYEEQWLVRAAADAAPIRPELDDLYDAYAHPRAERPSLPLLEPSEAESYIGLVRRKVLDSLEEVRLTPERPLLADGLVYRLVVQHEHQHAETMLATHQLRRGEPVLSPSNVSDAPRGHGGGEVLVPAGEFVMGASNDPWAYDNERPAHLVDLPAFWIDAAPVRNADYREFVESGGYDEPRWWNRDGWEWRCRSGKRAPAFWIRDGDSWRRRRFGVVEALPDDEPVQHVCWHEADAYARWAGRRLPTEAEWEKAASWDPVAGVKRRFPWGDEPASPEHANLGQRRLRPAPVGSFPRGASPVGALQLLGDVWEWTSSNFNGHPGFCMFPYPEYSETFFGTEYKVLRGGSWATDPTACRATFRNWDYPVRRQIFAGFRCARDV